MIDVMWRACREIQYCQAPALKQRSSDAVQPKLTTTGESKDENNGGKSR